MMVCVGGILVVWKTCGYGGLVASSPRMRCRSASLQTPFSILRFVSTDLKVRGYSPSASRLSDALFASSLHCHAELV